MRAAHLIEHVSEWRETVGEPQRVEAREAFAVPQVLDDAVEHLVAPVADATACRPEANAERWQSSRRQRIDVGKQHDERNVSRFGGEHAAKAEH